MTSMRLIILLIAATLMSGGLGCVPYYNANTETTRMYNNVGIYTGKSETRGNITRFYSADGKYIGKGETK